MRPYSISRVSTCLLAGLCVESAWAQDTPPIAVTAAYTVEDDETRLPTRTNTDQIGKAELGLLFHTIQSLQRIEGELHLVNYQYQTETQQSHTEANYTATWHWSVTPHLHGNLNASQQEAPKADAISGDGNAPNRQTQTLYRADAEYEVDGPWHVVAGVSRDKHTSQYVDPSTTDSLNDSRDLGLRYDFATGSWLKASLKSTDGHYLNGDTTTVNASDESYQQREQDLHMHWSLSVLSSADIYWTQIDRTHQRNSQLNFNGNNYGANATWQLSGRSVLVMDYVHALSVVIGATALFTERDSLSWGWNWQATSRTQLRIRQSLEKLGYRTQPNGGPTLQQDTSQDTSLSLVWTPGTQWQISAALQQQAHNSNRIGQDYTSQQVSLSAQYSF